MTGRGVLTMVWTGTGHDEKDCDLDLVQRTRDGDTEAFSELVRRHQRLTYNLALRFMRDPVQAEDMTQEAFLKAFRLINGYKAKARFSTWLYRVTCSVCLTELAKRKRRGEVALETAHIESRLCTTAVYDDTDELIRRLVLKLPDRYSKVLTMYYMKEISYDEISQVLCVPMGTLKTWMHRARRQLRKLVEQELSDDD